MTYRAGFVADVGQPIKFPIQLHVAEVSCPSTSDRYQAFDAFTNNVLCYLDLCPSNYAIAGVVWVSVVVSPHADAVIE